MDRERILALLRAVRDGERSPDQALEELGGLDIAELSVAGDVFARVDHHRGVRCGFPEVIFAPGKTPEQVARVAAEVVERSSRLLVTRVSDDQWAALAEAVPDAVRHERAAAATVDRDPAPAQGHVVVLSAGI